MSTAPRPQISPSINSPPNGSWCQPSGRTGTTSVWPIKHSDGASGSRPSIRATSELRPGVGSNRSIATPGPSTTCWRTSALRTSWPDSAVPSLTQALRISVCNSSTLLPVSPSSWRSSITAPTVPLPPFAARLEPSRGVRSRANVGGCPPPSFVARLEPSRGVRLRANEGFGVSGRGRWPRRSRLRCGATCASRLADRRAGSASRRRRWRRPAA